MPEKGEEEVREGPASDPEARKKAFKRAEERQERDRNDVRAVMGTEQGRRFIYQLIYDGHQSRRACVCGTDLMGRALDICPESVALMIREAQADAQRKEASPRPDSDINTE
jgi:hypothetical protein